MLVHFGNLTKCKSKNLQFCILSSCQNAQNAIIPTTTGCWCILANWQNANSQQKYWCILANWQNAKRCKTVVHFDKLTKCTFTTEKCWCILANWQNANLKINSLHFVKLPKCSECNYTNHYWLLEVHEMMHLKTKEYLQHKNFMFNFKKLTRMFSFVKIY